MKKDRLTIPGEIQYKHKKVETCTPGIGKYETVRKDVKIPGNYNQ